MELFYRLLIDTGLVILLVLSTLMGSLIVSNVWKGIIGLRSLSFSTMNSMGIFGTVFMVVPSFLPVVISSCIYGCIACIINNSFDYSDVSLISACFFLGVFFYMRGCGTPYELENIDKLKEQEYYDKHYELWWYIIDNQLIPTVILTSLVLLGLILSCYFNGLN